MKKTIFVVDDNETNLTIAAEVLKDKYNVLTMLSGARMFELLKKVTPHLILLDINMPEMNGFEVLTLLKSQSDYQHIPAIFLTASFHFEDDLETKGFELGVSDFIGKPFSPLVLFNRIKLQLDISEIVEERTRQLNEQIIQLEERIKQLERTNREDLPCN